MSALNGEVIVADQGDAEALQLRFFGDEFYARQETLDGYTVVYDSEQRRYCYALLAAGHFVSSGVPVGKPPPRGLAKHRKEDPAVRNAKFGQRYARLRPEEAEVVNIRTLGPDGGLLGGRKLHRDEVLGLTVLVDFDDVQSRIPKEEVEALFNRDDYRRNGNFCSVKRYFEIVSSGKLIYANRVVGPVRLSKRRSHYISNSLVQEAMDRVTEELGVDLEAFDSRGEGLVDAINFLYAGESQYSGELWPHNSYVDLQYNGIQTHYYQITGLGMHPADLRIGTICHENGHLLCRFPDMYDYGRRDGDHEKSQGIGRYCLMGSGNHLDERRTPAPVCAYLRELAGWVDHVVDLSAPGRHEAPHGRYDTVWKYRTDQPNEYFLVENRSGLGLDRGLPSSGLAVLHCDTLASNEWQKGTRNEHYQCALLQADGHLDLENNRNPGDPGDLFGNHPGVALSDETLPSSRQWDDAGSGLLIRDVSAPGERMRFWVGEAAQPERVAAESAPNLVIPDNDPAGASSVIEIAAQGRVTAVAVEVQIIHSWVRDLRVALRAPSGAEALLHEAADGDGEELSRVWRSEHSAALQALEGEAAAGAWMLHVADRDPRDVGRLLRWRLELGLRAEPGGEAEQRTEPGLAIPDGDAAGIVSTLTQTARGAVRELAVEVQISHPYIGDLEVDLVAPSGLSVRLHDREGDWRQDIRRTYDLASTPQLQRFAGQPVAGDWQLRVRDLASPDQGTLEAWALKIRYSA